MGWTSVQYREYFDLETLKFPDEMTRFEPGLPNYFSIVGLAQSLVELKEFGWENIYQRIKSNRSYLAEQLKSQGLELLTGDHDLSAGIISFRLPPQFSHRDAEAAFEKRDIKITTRRDYVRVSPHFLNQQDELDLFLKATQEIFQTKKTVSLSFPRTIIKNQEHKQGINLITGGAGSLGKTLAFEFLAQGHNSH